MEIWNNRSTNSQRKLLAEVLTDKGFWYIKKVHMLNNIVIVNKSSRLVNKCEWIQFFFVEKETNKSVYNLLIYFTF